MKAKYGSADIYPGTLIHGTLRTEDLIPAFRVELARIDPLAESAIVPADEDNPDDRTEELAELFDALDRQAPDGWYFGAHEGDGSDFGFWEMDE